MTILLLVITEILSACTLSYLNKRLSLPTLLNILLFSALWFMYIWGFFKLLFAFGPPWG